MARFDTAFDATGIEPTTGYDVLPAGKYRAQIVESEMRVTRNGMGQFLWLMLDIIEGQYQGRKLFDQLNLVNSNPQTVEIAQRTLSAICHATGKLQVNDSVDLHLVPMTIQVGVKPPKDGYSEKNTIRYLVPERTAPAAPAYQAAPTASQTPAAPAAAPWNRNG
ncbi:hypothetical protein CHU93_04685 [Sandarakinorhabdus cyanobacteriorum]|uniref:DUF669 domain-containing protein n=1 Tax=Sandarakinorhabdus cyanobacteriorum TaxID=1981098 RepID=A0A255YPX0_9SPHN|nr:DUF669 domain-containing protein [Sandarakinorhabdus cyanobacteriorum]OYQ31259.1 hypothetical protein CHU93_04685 [Sandarakinorhabdus cyanobacteriorum]